MTTKELPPARYPTAKDKADFFRAHGIEATPAFHGTGLYNDLTVRIEGGPDVVEQAISLATEHGLAVEGWSANQSVKGPLPIANTTWFIMFGWAEGTNLPKRYHHSLEELLSSLDA